MRANDRALARTAQFDILCILSWDNNLLRELKPTFSLTSESISAVPTAQLPPALAHLLELPKCPNKACPEAGRCQQEQKGVGGIRAQRAVHW